jgi:hypothetical protein
MRAWGFNILMFIFIFAVSAKLTEKLVNKYFYQDTSEKTSDGPKFLNPTKQS